MGDVNQTNQKSGGAPPDENDAFGSGVVFLLLTWLLLFAWMGLVTEALLVPWDTAIDRPPKGSWEREVNDFFEGSPGSRLPALLAVAASAGLLLLRIRREGRRGSLAWTFAGMNLVFVGADLVLGFVAMLVPGLWLPPAHSSPDTGYHRTWPAILVSGALLAALLAAQARAGRRRPPHTPLSLPRHKP